MIDRVVLESILNIEKSFPPKFAKSKYRFYMDKRYSEAIIHNKFKILYLLDG